MIVQMLICDVLWKLNAGGKLSFYENDERYEDVLERLFRDKSDAGGWQH